MRRGGATLRRWAQGLRTPSLVRRVVLALLGAFSLVGVVLVAQEWLTLQWVGPDNLALPGFTQAAVDNLPPQEAQARLVLQAYLGLFNQRRRQQVPPSGPILAQLRTPAGALVWTSPGLDAPATAPPSASAPDFGVETWAGQPYWWASARSVHWQVRMLEPVPSGASVVHEQVVALAQPMLIALPLLLVPLWLAVRSGLRPLQTLAQRLREREPDDASPLGIPLRHAELSPLITAHEALLARARQRIEAERRFVQDAAHELRTPLAVIVTQAHVVATAQQPAEREPARAALERAVGRASHLVHQLLTLAQLESASAAATPAAAPVDVVSLVRDLIIAAAPTAAQRDIELALDSPDSLWAPVDVAAFHSIVDNLLGNALRYLPAGGRVAVGLRCEPASPSPQLVLTVQDDGPGIPESQRERLFERFQRGHHPGVAGTGLGLAIVRQAAWRLGGQVRVGPGLAPGCGVGFEVRWPLVRH